MVPSKILLKKGNVETPAPDYQSADHEKKNNGYIYYWSKFAEFTYQTGNVAEKTSGASKTFGVWGLFSFIVFFY